MSRACSLIGLLQFVILWASIRPLSSQASDEPLQLDLDVPRYTEEEQNSPVMPDSAELRCDACNIIAQGVAGAFLHAESLRGRPLKEFQVDAILAQVCESGLDKYEVTKVGGSLRFDVPGAFKAESGGHIMKSTSAHWTLRLKQACLGIIGDIGEEVLYSKFRSHLPKPSETGKVRVAVTSQVAEAFVRDVCLRPQGRRDGKGRKKAASQSMHGSCDGNPFFSEAGWTEVLQLREKERHKIEL
mmetsp:Transcript_29423/g.80444  ORF Transcript_29423/g.80444 Transcript_29423/m.80444 type:complete len:243 (-) Transcript_29423:144-872(-)|eukprot:CAMPEP_0117523138 /NCGR_PEP_ID=MMETSP0784-20121206/34572_1 /TAXON_ID=39447 /ORGANISM="" /LENGTH=242 /DNA_ID=CAMNT_0005319239 /DNA_START=62 /DNA_END=793 /DNA_ORIENTATION=-